MTLEHDVALTYDVIRLNKMAVAKKNPLMTKVEGITILNKIFENCVNILRRLSKRRSRVKKMTLTYPLAWPF